jgi:hypothetical protein
MARCDDGPICTRIVGIGSILCRLTFVLGVRRIPGRGISVRVIVSPNVRTRRLHARRELHDSPLHVTRRWLRFLRILPRRLGRRRQGFEDPSLRLCARRVFADVAMPKAADAHRSLLGALHGQRNWSVHVHSESECRKDATALAFFFLVRHCLHWSYEGEARFRFWPATAVVLGPAAAAVLGPASDCWVWSSSSSSSSESSSSIYIGSFGAGCSSAIVVRGDRTFFDA